MKKLGFNIILLGMIASGKDTQAKILKRKYALKFIESGIYWRRLLKEKSSDGDWVRRTVGVGKPAPVLLMKKFLVDQISKKPKNKDLLFLGNPRLKPEAQLLKKIMESRGEKILAFYITLPDKEVYRRSQKRTTKNIHSDYKVFDTRKLIAKRIIWHKEQVGKTVKYFEKLGCLKKINGNQPIEKVANDIQKVIDKYNNKTTP